MPHESSPDRNARIASNLSKIKHKIAIMSGKGGVGKTTIALNLSALLAKSFKVGLIDADIDCPNVFKFLGINEKHAFSQERLIPFESNKIKVVSMAGIQKQSDQAIIWRGPLIATTLMQFFELPEWGELDFLIIDLSPGTSDAALTSMQAAQLDGIIIVSSPQGVSLIDARKAVNMCKQLNKKVLGLVENFSGEIFGQGAVESLAIELQLPFLGRISLSKELNSIAEKQKLPALEDKKIAKEFETIKENLLKQI
ncbi:MAG: P-loop NTPase [archaeon]|nr:P-loop NTPase [archaeon]